MSLKGYIEGAIGENDAKEFLEKNGYQILEQNYKNKLGEIDLIAKDKGYIVFIEVKARENDKFGRPCEFVTPSKIRKVQNTALVYLKEHRLTDADIRFDVVEILGDEINLIKNAF